ncbi:hypothetical protein IEQ34_007438 [Dendrobium chrysotoxum]|uniref:Cytochrome P450 n=1 Tax=Dendrobium chrysotoxum TaxID=161865 RepID=A0AAV7H6P9_DENCH|nr:hypothetical protein IEQ34_007438 [Dendrobium chrysotoxum]
MIPSWSFIGEISGLRHGMEQVHKEMDGVLNEIIIKRNGEMDLSLMMENVKAVVIDLFLAGSDTTSARIIWAIIELILHPKVMQKAQLEVWKVLNGKRIVEEGDKSKLPYLNKVIKETLRLHPTAPLLLPRLCRETVELGGFTIPVEIYSFWWWKKDLSRGFFYISKHGALACATALLLQLRASRRINTSRYPSSSHPLHYPPNSPHKKAHPSQNL